MYCLVHVVLYEGRELSFKNRLWVSPCIVRRKVKRSVRSQLAFNDKFTASLEPVLLDLTGSKYRLGRCLLLPHSESAIWLLYGAAVCFVVCCMLQSSGVILWSSMVWCDAVWCSVVWPTPKVGLTELLCGVMAHGDPSVVNREVFV